MTVVSHWDARYAEGVDGLCWTQDASVATLHAIDRLGIAPTEAVIDAGGGASPLVRTLLSRGFDDVTVVDVSPAALKLARASLGAQGATVTWVAADLRGWPPPRTYDLWHDRAAWHFLIDDPSRDAYRATLELALPPGGALVVEAFAADGPDSCSGLPVQRYTVAGLLAAFGDGYVPVAEGAYTHYTPWMEPQPFVWVAMRRDQ